MGKLVTIVLLYPSLLFAQFFNFGHHNKFKKGERHGIWKIYTDSTRSVIESRGRYRRGSEKGVWKYYYPSGKIRKKEVWRFRKIKTANYYESGKIQSCGRAKLVVDDTHLHYFRYGDWIVYLENGQVNRISTYYKGKVINEKIVNK